MSHRRRKKHEKWSRAEKLSLAAMLLTVPETGVAVMNIEQALASPRTQIEQTSMPHAHHLVAIAGWWARDAAKPTLYRWFDVFGPTALTAVPSGHNVWTFAVSDEPFERALHYDPSMPAPPSPYKVAEGSPSASERISIDGDVEVLLGDGVIEQIRSLPQPSNVLESHFLSNAAFTVRIPLQGISAPSRFGDRLVWPTTGEVSRAPDPASSAATARFNEEHTATFVVNEQGKFNIDWLADE
jgi:hypothetical protein